ncbi:MAG: glycosyltransferase [Pseudomonadota bacterium]|nr:glycosyltransferase [Pseudomonadota bacterium]
MNPHVKEQSPAHLTESIGQSLGEIKTEANENYGQSLTQLTILVSYSGSGGVEVITNHLVEGLVNAGIQVELLLLKARGPHIDKLPEHPGLKVTKLNASSAMLAVPELVSYLNKHPNRLLFVIKDRAVQAASIANRINRCKSRIVGQIHTNMRTGLASRNGMMVRLRFALMRLSYRYLTGVIAVSQDAANALQTITGLPEGRIKILPNPVVTPAIAQKSSALPVHPWLTNKECPVVVAAGRLSSQKNFALLIRAFSLLRQQTPMKLVIFGEGPLRSELEALCAELGILDHVSLFGFVENPYAEMKRSDLFVLSSDCEGSPTVLTECLSMGIPCVATDVGDVAQTLQNGRVGRVVPCNDTQALAEAMRAAIQSPLAGQILVDAVRQFQQDTAVSAYIEQLSIWQETGAAR